jgi:hypothetical protein
MSSEKPVMGTMLTGRYKLVISDSKNLPLKMQGEVAKTKFLTEVIFRSVTR